ncbi:MAG: inositol 2-dehydrogenase [Chloroflexi bacterium]|nr:inositol 2-dehydrogenase [Chloroflexota bacterium]MCI0578003.1 inositol 2-dehydrogenase [Chloroflexota bacterium]MCI0646701.1 inositol 2-dehydrogenase [Chloroflexota bacterium]MCI0726102.1 inositol 2-dehydrogenase [Chloroflexota bacterium]
MNVRIALIGAGRMGATLAHHLAFSLEMADFVAIADPNPENATGLAQKLGVAAVYSDYQEMLARSDLDAVVIVTPTNTHVEVIQAAAAAGKHIFTEKPLALTLAGCDEAIAAVEAAGVKMQVGFMRHFDPAYMAAKQKIDEGAIGRPVMFKSTGRDPWRTSLEYARRENSGGLIADMGAHDFDLARWLMGDEVVRVYSEGECLVFPELKEVGDIDNAVVNLKFANEAVGNVDLSRNAIYGYDIRTEIIGSEGSLMVGGLQQTPVLLLKPNNVSHDTIPGFMARFATAYAAELRAFVTAVAEDRPVAVDGRDARAVTAIGVAATRSLDEGRPVWLSEIG